MATGRPVRIARAAGLETDRAAETGERRVNVAGSQRALRVTVVYLVVLVALFAAFVLYDRSAPGGTASPSTNGIYVFTGLFVVFAFGGAIFTLHPAPRALEVGPDRVTVVGRWGGRRVLPPLGSLSTRVVRRYPPGLLSGTPVEQIELWGRDVPLRTYLVEDGLFRGANATEDPR